MCEVHKVRPYNCRIYGITPNEEFEPRYEKLKKEYDSILGAVIKPQCGLVSTVDDKEITKKDIDDWWEELVEIERSIGIPKDMITDAMGGSYRTPHDHVLLYNMPENVLNALSGIKQYTDEFDKKKAIKELIQVIKNVFRNKS
jgi:Txe/YoeB family toxin of Txe-Axe toxin-antitoxin module